MPPPQAGLASTRGPRAPTKLVHFFKFLTSGDRTPAKTKSLGGVPPKLGRPCVAARLQCFRGRSPARTWRPTRAAPNSAPSPAGPGPDHPLRSIRCSQCRGASRPITLHTRQLLDSTAIYPFMSAVLSPPGCLRIRLRIPPSSSLSESFKFKLRNIGACRSSGPRVEHAPLRADLECQCTGLHAASPARRSAGETPSDRSLRLPGERKTPL